ncbi:6-carboxytetrahydropterin synthase [Adlercreutzia sp. ZJ138]|uniref:6-pyruvoyl trahydropterin synthase family protein n=1 Tax=Adlercreutzia sp. ZJ138 TaxID=2709405 RepID=UPI0013EC5045|nr:6-carboxytetrahydropterin synthase [Adlercreutzia sp. ZJ138]
MYGMRTEAKFDAAHFLTDYDGKCENLHGHCWRVVAYIEQEELQAEGQSKDMVVDFSVFKRALRSLANEFDHTFIVEEGSLEQKTMACLENETFRMTVLPFRSTSENLARYFSDRLVEMGFPVQSVEMYETATNCAIYYPNR